MRRRHDLQGQTQTGPPHVSRCVEFPTTYADADAILGRRDSRVIANNTREDTAADATAPDGVDGERWSDYNRKFNDLLAGRAG